MKITAISIISFLVIPAAMLFSDPSPHTADGLELVAKRVDAKSAILIDVREQKEWDDGHLKSAKLVPLSKLNELPEGTKSIDGLSKDKIIYCHCRSGGRVLRAAPILKEMGYDIRPLKAGYVDLVEAGFAKADIKGM